MLTVIVIGGSVSNGFRAAGAGWADLLKKAIESASADAIVYGLGIYGDTSTQVARRFTFEVKPRLRPKGRNIVILQVGGNDTTQRRLPNGQLSPVYQHGFWHRLLYWLAPRLRSPYKVSLRQFERNLRRVLKKARRLQVELVVQLIPPVNEHATVGSDPSDQVPAVSPRFVKTNAAADLFNRLLLYVFGEDAVFVDAAAALGEDYPRLLHADGVHPEREGHSLLYGAYVETLSEMGVEFG